WQAIDQITSNYYEAVVTSINAGVDLNMVPFDTTGFINAMNRAVRSGDISEDRVDDAVRRILTVKMQLGLFERPLQDPSLLAQVGSDEHRALARQAVAESMVLLQNENNALPVSKEVGRIFIGGQFGDDIGLQSGGWTIEWQGASGEITEGTTFLEATETAVSANSEVYFDRFGRFDDLFDDGGDLMRADVGFVLLGERPYAEGRGDRADLSINATMIERMRERVDVLVVVLVTGRPLIITDALPLADAWVVAWWPGTEGAGMTDVLFGDQDFSGKLPFSWPRSNEQLPFDFENMPLEGCAAPLFPFGYGLTYEDGSLVAVGDC
ncbi:MAG: glycoside hydrolase family 3 C-terminal domain-containing protein, partial [Chloroflexota bacterium]